MKNRPAIAAATTLVGLAFLATLGACMPNNDGGTGSAGSSGGGSAGSAVTGGHAGTGTGAGGAAGTSCSAGGAAGSSDLANWDTMRMIVQVQCGGPGCHNDTQAPHMVDDASLYGTLTTYVSQMCGNRPLVKPCAPDESAFYLAQKGGLCGSLERMPKGCVDLCTPDNYLEGIRQWIANGALKQ